MQRTGFVEICGGALFISFLVCSLSASKLVKKCSLKRLRHETKDVNYRKARTPTKHFKPF